MKKLEQMMLLLTCLTVMAVAAIQRDGRVWGHALADTAQTTEGRLSAVQTLRTLDDGTIVVNTTAIGKDIAGYGGPVPLEIRLKDGRVAGVKALANTETPDFFDKAKSLLTRWDGKTIEEAEAQKVDAVSGATFSSQAIIGNVRRGLQFASSHDVQPSLLDKLDLSAKSIAGLVVVLMAAVIPLFFKNKGYRTVQLSLNVVVLGFWCGTFLSWSLFVNYMSSGINLWTSLIPVVMLVTAFVYPLFGKKNYYCTNICPFGSIQDLVGKTNRHKWKMGQATVKRLEQLRQLLFAVLMVLMLTGTAAQWMDYEVFTAFIFQSAAAVVVAMGVVFAVLAAFVPRPYCRFVCPTGTLFKMAENRN